MKFNKNHAGLALGSLTALGHLFWLVLVAIGLAKPLLDFVLSLHHFEMQYVISSFDVVKSIGLLILTFVVGYVLGWVLAAIWNKCQK